MNFASALISMKQGYKVGRKHWEGYWYLVQAETEDDHIDQIIIHEKDGNELNLLDTDDILFTLSNIACDDWEIKGEI